MAHVHASRALFIPGPAGRLEALLWTPVHPNPPVAAVICHPHPLFGGTMHSKVVFQVARTLDLLGIPALRFNFRGTGLSQGAHDNGRGEQGDLCAALDLLAAEFPALPLLVAGFSFGCRVGLRAGCADSRVAELIGLGAPVADSDFTFLAACRKPRLFVQGENDQFGAPVALEALLNSLPEEVRATTSLVIVPGADHFFAGKLRDVDRAVTDWLLARHQDLGVD